MGNLANDIGAPIVAKCFGITLTALSPEIINEKITREIALSGESSLAAEIARRAVITSCKKEENRAGQFVIWLFTYAMDYLISQDISGYIGCGKRISNVSGVIELKKDIIQKINNVIEQSPRAGPLEQNPKQWKAYINSIIVKFTNGNRDE
jgi:hypothetical protein